MADEVFDIDQNSIYPSIVKPAYARGSTKSQTQLQLYDAFLKGEINMGAGVDAWKTFLETNQVKVGIDLAGNEIRDMTLKGENEMNIKETLNKIYGTSVSTNATIKDDITQEDVMNAIKTVEEVIDTVTGEEWVWVKGFKGTEKDMSCKGYQYELGKQFDLDEDLEPSVCHNSFHFCKELSSVFGYYSIGNGNRYFEVEALVKKSDLDPNQRKNYSYITGDKYAAKSIRFIRELTPDEVFDGFGASDACKWDEAQKKRAMVTNIQAVRAELRVDKLIEAGYSHAFAQYVAQDYDRCKTALAVASLPDVSMDVKVMAIFMNNHD